jgi:hypothetical protein
MPQAMIQECSYYFPSAANTLVIKYSTQKEATSWSAGFFYRVNGGFFFFSIFITSVMNEQ